LRLLRSGIRSEVEYLALILATWSRSAGMIGKELLLAQVHCILIVINSKTIGLAQIRLTPLSMSGLFSNKIKYMKLINAVIRNRNKRLTHYAAIYFMNCYFDLR